MDERIELILDPARAPNGCPGFRCPGHVVKKTGVFGTFWGCSTWSNCWFTEPAFTPAVDSDQPLGYLDTLLNSVPKRFR